MKQTIQIGTILATFRDMRRGDDSKLEVGDYVVAVTASHGWGNVEPGMVGQVIEAYGNSQFEVNFGRYHSDWTGDRYCFVNLGKELTGDLHKQLRQSQDEKFVNALSKMKKRGVEDIVIETIVDIQALRYRDRARVRVTVPLKTFSRLRTYNGFRERVLYLITNAISTDVHPTRVRKLFDLSAMGILLGEIDGEEIVAKEGVK